MTEIDALVYARGGKIFAIFDIIARYISVTVQDSPIMLLMTTRNQVWSNNGDIANDLE